ncbi:unnamed protein product [Euphydryas editha]|uniref:Ig-like domain-containing protein n=1 Tax=Euphydryas editha TaxID=104508 RepID=A0AAU9TM96_EUPED|nr:unnamed protein product [Euphydryas editha]
MIENDLSRRRVSARKQIRDCNKKEHNSEVIIARVKWFGYITPSGSDRGHWRPASAATLAMLRERGSNENYDHTVMLQRISCDCDMEIFCHSVNYTDTIVAPLHCGLNILEGILCRGAEIIRRALCENIFINLAPPPRALRLRLFNSRASSAVTNCVRSATSCYNLLVLKWKVNFLAPIINMTCNMHVLLAELLSCGETGGDDGVRARRYVGLYTGPYFDPSAPNNITAQLGTHAYLPCKVRQLSNKSVSWIRRRDAHILTVDRFTFIADERFQAFLVEATDTWTLQVKYVQARDAGVYECQVGTEPKMSHFVQLNVVVPKIEIVGESDLYVKAGSTVSLKCVITQALEEPAYIFWYHNDERVLNYDRSLVEIRMERLAPDTTIGNLIIYNPRREDSGNYSCSPSNLDSASVVLHVLSGEQPAAMQHGNGAAAHRARAPALLGALAALAACAAPRAARLPALLALALLLPLQCHDEDSPK